MSAARIFISYSHQGNGPGWKDALVRALHVFERHQLLDVWQDGRIRVSSFWDDDIRQAMDGAQVAVLLLTREALESEYILGTEFPYLRNRQIQDKVPVFPVICEECDWKAHGWLRVTQAPNRSNPLSQLSSAAQDGLFRKLATDIAGELGRNALAGFSVPVNDTTPGCVYLDRFPLSGSGRPGRLVGREQEATLLDLAFAQPDTSIVSLVAWGGVGKTMLVRHWLRRLQRAGWFGARRVYAWSFYSQGTKEDRQASEDAFLAHALEWFDVQCEPTLASWEKGRLLADAVCRERTLLILDGIEPLQYPPGPMGGQLRAPGIQSLLKQLASKANAAGQNGLCLVTTREPLTDLSDFQRNPTAAWGSVLRVDLGNLNEEAGAALLHHTGAKRSGAAGIKEDDAELQAASREVDGHALTLNLLGRFLARAHEGDIRRRDLVKFEEADRREQGGTTFKMLAAFENWFSRSGEFGARQLSILRMLGLFDRPADAGCIGALRESPAIPGLTDPLFLTVNDTGGGQASPKPLMDEDWNTAKSFLNDFGLIAFENEMRGGCGWIDCHPLVREYFSSRVHMRFPAAWRIAHHRLFRHLLESAEENPVTLYEHEPLYRAIRHGCLADNHSMALDEVYRRRIRRDALGAAEDTAFSIYRLGAIDSDLAAMANFYEIPWQVVSNKVGPLQAAFIFDTTALCLRALGFSCEAEAPVEQAQLIRLNEQELVGAAQSACNKTLLLQSLGKLSRSRGSAEECVRLADLSGMMGKRINYRRVFAESLTNTGEREQAGLIFSQAKQMMLNYGNESGCWHYGWGFNHIRFLLEQGALDDAELQLDGYLEHALNEGSFLDINLFNMAKAEIQSLRCGAGVPPEFLCAIDEGIQGLRSCGRRDFLPVGLLIKSKVLCKCHDCIEASMCLNEAWDIAERGPMRLHLADIHLHRARLFFREEHYPWESPQADLVAAEKLINVCGYHRRDGELADAKRVILGV